MSYGKEHLIVALDYPTIKEAKKLIDLLGDEVSIYKVGLELYLNTNGKIIEYLSKKKKKIFLDLKFHDIPNTTAMASIFAAMQDVFMFNIHISGGANMIKTCVDKISKVQPKPYLIGVTILTSLSDKDLSRLFLTKQKTSDIVFNLAKIGYENGLDGVVCSAREAIEIKKTCSQKFITVCPGIRPTWASGDDQERIMTPKEAVKNGCDYLVIGRPITKHENPLWAARAVLKEMNEGAKNDY